MLVNHGAALDVTACSELSWGSSALGSLFDSDSILPGLWHMPDNHRLLAW